MRAAVLGLGSVGARIANQLISSPLTDEVVAYDPDTARRDEIRAALDPSVVITRERRPEADVVVLAGPARSQARTARRYLRRGGLVVSTTDDVAEVRSLLALDRDAIRHGAHIVVGAGFSPGLTCVLTKLAVARFDMVSEIHVAKDGTAGPACARQHHRALRGLALDWRDGDWVDRPAGSGRELVWFPDPIGGLDCYRARLAEPLLLMPHVPDVERVTARVSATRRDRLTMGLPMMRPPHADAGTGAIRVEVRGTIDGGHDVLVYGMAARPGVAAAAVAVVATNEALEGGLGGPGSRGLMPDVDPAAFLRRLHSRGVRATAFAGR
ncbi:MAG: NAD(P)-binding domain-containing protein [Actinomycetia bacterium]|nr:NAD(P)-binding domain-containing protein [Actinomycetes bacterium]